MNKTRRTRTTRKKDDGTRSGYVILSLFIIAVLGLCLRGYNHQADAAGSVTTKAGLTQGAIHVAMQEPMEIPLSKGVPVGTLKLNGKTYVIYTTNENDRLR